MPPPWHCSGHRDTPGTGVGTRRRRWTGLLSWHSACPQALRRAPWSPGVPRTHPVPSTPHLTLSPRAHLAVPLVLGSSLNSPTATEYPAGRRAPVTPARPWHKPAMGRATLCPLLTPVRVLVVLGRQDPRGAAWALRPQQGLAVEAGEDGIHLHHVQEPWGTPSWAPALTGHPLAPTLGCSATVGSTYGDAPSWVPSPRCAHSKVSTPGSSQRRWQCPAGRTHP